MKKISKNKTIVFDLDGVICTQTSGDYENAIPVAAAVRTVNKFHKEGYVIVIHTARFMGRFKGDPKRAHSHGYDATKKFLKKWGVRHHKLVMGKPRSDVVVDDRAIFFRPDWDMIEKEIRRKLK